jgi:hypothetical protein
MTVSKAVHLAPYDCVRLTSCDMLTKNSGMLRITVVLKHLTDVSNR